MATRKQPRGARRATIIGGGVGFIIIFTFLISLLAPDRGSGNTSSSSSGDVFSTPIPVAPAPDLNPHVEGAPAYVHSSGYFRAFQPAGSDWTISETGDPDSPALARVVFNSGAKLAVLHNYIQDGVEFETLESLSDNYLTRAYWAGEWSAYDSDWVETGRTVGPDAVITDFTLSVNGIDYLGRAINWLTDGLLYTIRIVAPDNNPTLIDLLQSYAETSFRAYPDLMALNAGWPTFIDQDLGYVIKHAYDWRLVAGGVGRPATFRTDVGQGQTTIRVLTEPERPLASQAEAEDWLRAAEPTAEVLGVETLERGAGTGWLIAYAYADSSGDAHSGLVALLNDAAGTLFSANLQIDAPDVNLLNVADLAASDQNARSAVQQGFIVLPDADRTPAAE